MKEAVESEKNLWKGLIGIESSRKRLRSLNVRRGIVRIEMRGTELKNGRKSVEPSPATKNFEPKKNLKAQKRIVSKDET